MFLNNLYACPFNVAKSYCKNHSLNFDVSQITLREMSRLNRTSPLIICNGPFFKGDLIEFPICIIRMLRTIVLKVHQNTIVVKESKRPGEN